MDWASPMTIWLALIITAAVAVLRAIAAIRTRQNWAQAGQEILDAGLRFLQYATVLGIFLALIHFYPSAASLIYAVVGSVVVVELGKALQLAQILSPSEAKIVAAVVQKAQESARQGTPPTDQSRP